MNRQEDSFLDDVRKAKPPLWPPADDWVNSERGQQVLERVLANDRTTGARDRAQHRRAGWWSGPRLAFAAGAFAVVAVAVTLAVVIASRGDRQNAVTQSTLPAAEQVSGATAVADLMPLYRLKAGKDLAPEADGVSVRVEQAVLLGLISREEASGAWSSTAMTQGQYAVLLVKAFGSVLPQGTFPEQPVDTRATPDERQAIAALVTSGIILSQDGAFVAGQILTKDVEDRLLSRVEEAYRRLVGE